VADTLRAQGPDPEPRPKTLTIPPPGDLGVAPIASTDEEFARLRGIISALGVDATMVAERLPAPLWRSLVPAAASDALSRGIRDVFDPDHLMNPGILGELS